MHFWIYTTNAARPVPVICKTGSARQTRLLRHCSRGAGSLRSGKLAPPVRHPKTPHIPGKQARSPAAEPTSTSAASSGAGRFIQPELRGRAACEARHQPRDEPKWPMRLPFPPAGGVSSKRLRRVPHKPNTPDDRCVERVRHGQCEQKKNRPHRAGLSQPCGW